MAKKLLVLLTAILILSCFTACDEYSGIKDTWFLVSIEEYDGDAYKVIGGSSSTIEAYMVFNDTHFKSYYKFLVQAEAIPPGVYTCPEMYMSYSMIEEKLYFTVALEPKLITYELDSKNLILNIPNDDYPDYPNIFTMKRSSSKKIANAVEDCDIF